MEQQRYLKVIHHSHTIHKIFVENEECAKKEVLKTCEINWYPHFCRKSTEIFQPFFWDAFIQNNKMHCVFEWNKYCFQKYF